MSEFVVLFLTFLVVLNPPAALLTWRSLSETFPESQRLALGGAAIVLAAGGLLVAAALGEEVIDGLDMSLSSFQVGTGLLLILGVLRVFVTRNPWMAPRYEGNFEAPIAGLRMAVWLATPASLAAAAFYGADRGQMDTMMPLTAALVITAVATLCGPALPAGPWLLGLREAGRGIAIVLVVLAIDLLLDGITRV